MTSRDLLKFHWSFKQRRFFRKFHRSFEHANSKGGIRAVWNTGLPLLCFLFDFSDFQQKVSLSSQNSYSFVLGSKVMMV